MPNGRAISDVFMVDDVAQTHPRECKNETTERGYREHEGQEKSVVSLQAADTLFNTVSHIMSHLGDGGKID